MKKLIFLFALAGTLAFSQTQVVPITNSHVQLFDASGKPCAGCLLDTFTAGTTSALATFSESTGTSLNSNPVVADANGYVTVYFQLTSYKLRLRSAAGVTIWTQDGISPVSPLSPITFPVTLRPATAATGGANQSSPALCFDSFYFNITSLTDAWCLVAALGAGASPTSTLSITHSGSGGLAAINLPVGLQLNFVQSTLANAAGSGFVRLANTDQECWRNAANGADVCNTDAGAAAAGTGNLADLLKWGGGGFQGTAFVDKNATPAQSGVVRTGNNVCAVASRNAAASGDVCAVQVDNSNITNLGGSAGVKVAGPLVTAAGVGTTFTGTSGSTSAVPESAAGGTFTMLDINSGSVAKAQLTADFTLAANTNLQTIGALTFTTLANAQNLSFHCAIGYSQATAAVSNQLGIQIATNAPTNATVNSIVYTSNTVSQLGNLAGLASTTATAFATFTPSATATTFDAFLDGTIELPASAHTINFMASQSNAADLLTFKRGSYCQIF